MLAAWLLFIGDGFLHAQNLYEPRNIKDAIKNGTRSMDGNPGKNYWQNEGKYDISVTVTPGTKMISGVEKINYVNNSPDTLKFLAIRFVNKMYISLNRPGAVTQVIIFLRPAWISNHFLLIANHTM